MWRGLASMSAIATAAASVVCPEGKELGVTSRPGARAVRSITRCLTTCVVAAAPATSTTRCTTIDARRWSRARTTATRMAATITGTVTVFRTGKTTRVMGPVSFCAAVSTS